MLISINDYNLSTNTTVIGAVFDESTPQELNLMKLARKDGAKLISSNFAPKEITLSGGITGTSRANLESNIDTFKQNTMIIEGTLDIDYAGGYRRFTVDCSQCIVTRERQNINIAVWELKYIVPDPPFGEEIDAIAGSPIMNEAYSADLMTGQVYDPTITIAGTQNPKPKIEMVIDTAGTLGNLSIKNKTTNTQIDIFTAWTSGDNLVIDTDAETTQKNTSDVEYEGIFPEFDLGSNELEISSSALSGQLNQSQTTSTYFQGTSADYHKLAQSFKPNGNINIDKVELLLWRSEIPYGDFTVTVRIETDSGGSPSGTLVNANATKTITGSSGISTTPAWTLFTFPAVFAVSTATLYWIVVSASGFDESSLFWSGSTTNTYADGSFKHYIFSWGTSSILDAAFKVYANIVPDWEYSTKISYQKRYK